ncbi:ABC-type Fe3+-hydroxamate transport system substrate-binding protein [Paenibacillus cellulosilyticus]|uniref:ABC-type Fe3+-hydroxamate transport system substrate-binding protein n=1 Tax=Paenibacillus cellulosilyticus TaxID=375489 RepID=A0A2V2YUJ4_9BACL|nr:helix-turn-helix domain-containing protein [Paenibacillus cellulosilyticus]PWV99483.1 ABC-type Fe3+-hydroxamate transport system substrate-binding protein [Paenibacillus cellulosilyticus]QKS44737.1 AraC family transcriptional regulator [Paenibacillus cellulosilyticus]
MTTVTSEWINSHFPIYSAANIQSLYTTTNMPTHKINEPSPVLIGVARGKGILRIDDHAHELAEGKVVLLPAHSHAVLIANPQHPLHAYRLSIHTMEQTAPLLAGAMIQKSEMTSHSNMKLFSHVSGLVALMEELYIHRATASEIRHVQNQIVFHQIILQLLKQNNENDAAGDQPSLERSIAYLENHYMDKISREHLAEIAGVSHSHYSILFKRMTGFSPKEYLSRLRIHRAMELLISGSGTLREIALEVGYKDEFYLSRRFKQHTGTSPSGYNHRTNPRVAVLLPPYASHLITLGLEPTVIIAESNEYVNTTELEPPQSITFINASSSSEQIDAALLHNGIELIIAANMHLDMNDLNLEHLRAIAPVIDISWMDLGWKEHLRLIAKAVHRSELAEQWLAAFEQEEQEARPRVQQSAAANEIITVLVSKTDGLYVYGARNAGYVLYQSLGLRPPERIRREIDKLGDRFHSIPIELSELRDYAGDRILVSVYPDEKGSSSHSDALFNSSYWRALPAVQRKNVHLLELDEWIPYNPISIRLQLQRAIALFVTNQ